LRPRVLAVLTAESQSRAAIARVVGRNEKDRSVGRVLADLERDGEADRAGGGWRRVAGSSAPIGRVPPCHPPEEHHGKGEKEGGNHRATVEGLPLSGREWSAETADAFLEHAKRAFPGSYELAA